MTVTVLLPGVLRADADNLSLLTAQLPPSATLRDLFSELAVSHPRLERRVRDEQGGVRRYVNVYVDDEECRVLGGMGAPLRDGAQVRILPSVAGG